jgi:hypothetical protein
MPTSLHKSAATASAAPKQIPARDTARPLAYIDPSAIAQIASLAREIANGTRGTVRRKACRIVELAESNGGVK